MSSEMAFENLKARRRSSVGLHEAFAHEGEKQPQMQLAYKFDVRIAALKRLDAIEHVHPIPAVVWSCAASRRRQKCGLPAACRHASAGKYIGTTGRAVLKLLH